MHIKIDHFAIGAKILEHGVAVMKAQLGVTVPTGGKHAAMSTHNCVMQSGQQSLFELIAVDPDAPDPGRTRWYTLDDARTKERLAARPRALCWVVGTDDLDAEALRDVLKALHVDHLAKVGEGAAALSFKMNTLIGSVVLD